MTGSAASLRHRIRRLLDPAWRGVLWRTNPVSAEWGFDRGTPIDRRYIERFLAANRSDICGRVLEIQSADYTRRFGVAVQTVDVLDINSSNTAATIVADLTAADQVPSAIFDCVIP
jgi:hypothetical protein